MENSMKKFALTSLSLALLGAAGPAQAQTSVTLYGVIDTGIGYVSHANANGDKLFGMINGNLSGDRWGLKGQEDLGGGLKAIFQLESGFDVGTGRLGQGDREFGRQAFVGLSGNQWGTVTLGRQYDPLVDMVQGITADNYWGAIFATPGDVDNYDNSLRVSNAVKYVSPNFSGFQVEGLYGFSNMAGTTGQGQTWSAAATYNNGPLAVAGGYFYANNPSADRMPITGSTWTSPSSDPLFDGPINNAYALAHAIGIARGAIQYSIGAFTVGGSYSNAQYKADAGSRFGSQHFNVGNGFVNFQVTPALLTSLGYTYTKAGGDTSATYHQVSIGADYSLSKRTDFYAVAAYQHASGDQRDATTGGTNSAQASIGSYGYESGRSHQEMVILGMRHKF
ncbi:Outer membrane protein (porin) [Candidatus Paraburkholderia kirkii UZHbot1]|uniref:Outer membrane protein (Porin) n=1 Tax=Candidatus Paraburkholderia kirkii UZHbot1 TaxID=1055526 RepID=G4MEB8_9BURK|nr:Outer membrane protein (porin) [Candidatus Paraburkholderia kirkii UZHbot1]